MCASARINQLGLKPSDFVGVWTALGELGFFVWAGFATTEKLGWWKRNGRLVDFPATHFAERHDVTKELIWDEMPAGQVIRALVTNDRTPLLKVVTRAATEAEIARFGHDRMPVIEPPLFSAELPKIDPPKKPKKPEKPKPLFTQGELF